MFFKLVTSYHPSGTLGKTVLLVFFLGGWWMDDIVQIVT